MTITPRALEVPGYGRDHVVPGDKFMIDLFEGPAKDGRWRGTTYLYREHRDSLDGDCRIGLEDLEQAVGHDLIPYRVSGSVVSSDFHNLGLGARLYLEGARAVAPYGAIVAEACAHGATSAAAWRVWESTRLEPYLLRDDAGVAVLRPGAPEDEPRASAELKRKLMR